MTNVMSQAWKVIRPHVPLIRFRKGGSERGTGITEAGTAAVSAIKTPAIKSTGSGSAIEDWQLPARYRRQLLDDKEIDAINSGGAY